MPINALVAQGNSLITLHDYEETGFIYDGYSGVPSPRRNPPDSSVRSTRASCLCPPLPYPLWVVFSPRAAVFHPAEVFGGKQLFEMLREHSTNGPKGCFLQGQGIII